MIPFLDLGKVNEPYQAEMEEAALRVLRSGWYILGKELERFETEFAEFCGTSCCVGVANGLEALELILAALDFPGGSEVIVPANTYIASVLPVNARNLKPVFVEPDPVTMLIDPARIEEKITPATRAIMVVHLYGRCCEMEEISRIADRHNLRVIGDAAQAHGAAYRGKRAGGLAYAEAFSFYPTKNLGALGDAGAITTDDPDLARRLRILRNYGSGVKYSSDYQGINSRLDELQAALLSVKLPYMEAENRRRREIAGRYLGELRLEGMVLPPSDRIGEDCWHLFVVRIPQREKFIRYLAGEGIQTNVHYPVPIHRQRAYSYLSGQCFPLTDAIHDTVVSLPLNSTLKDEDVEFIIRTVNSYHCT